ncbi:MAG TPA: type II toxin-antitoxin system VapC family toxin [Chloroflexota bacterium]|nr:type II toxin-antitoxin system VapC family toxin [Chloroflexota bacterium]
MTFLLDTNVCIRFLTGRSEKVKLRLQQINPDEIAVCSVVKAELFYGARRSNNPEKSLQVQIQFLNQFASFPFDDDAAEVYGLIRANLAAKGTPIGPNDLMIAAIALANDLTLITHNVSEFGRIAMLKFEDWES